MRKATIEDLKQHMIEIALRFISCGFPEKPDWTGSRWEHVTSSILKEKGLDVNSLKEDGVIP